MSQKLNSVFRILIIFMLVFSIFSGVSAGTASASAQTIHPTISVSLVEQTPFPAQPGQQIRFWVQIENTGGGPLSNVTVQVVPDAIFSVSAAESSRTFPTINSGARVFHEYIMHVAADAPDGPRELVIRYRAGNATLWTEQRFTVSIGGIIDSDNRGTLIIESVRSNPEVFKPGDSGIVWVTLKNNATAQTVPGAGRTVYTTNARIQSANLNSRDNIHVRSEAVNDLGLIAPQDNVSIPFRVSIPKDTPDGTYILTLSVVGSTFEYNFKRNIEVRVDSSDIRVIQSRPVSTSAIGKTVEVDIVNPRQGTVRGVSIIPEGEGMTFYPAEFFIGEMRPNDLFTARFNVSQGAGDSNVTFRAVYFNGDNAHEDNVIVDIGPPVQPPSGIMTLFMYLILLLLIAAVVGHIYLKKKRNMSLVAWLKLKKAAVLEKRKNKKGKSAEGEKSIESEKPQESENPPEGESK